MSKISIYEPNVKEYSSSAIKAIESGWISNHGEYIQKSTELLSQTLDVPYVILMSNGTCSTHCLFLSLQFRYPTINRIYVPSNAYIAAWNSLLMVYNQDILSVMKMDENTWNIDTSETYLKSLESNSAVLIVHNIGNIINVPRLKRIRPDLIFVEDNCEGLFGKYESIYSGTSPDSLCSSVSFYGNKIITTGEGGAFITNHSDIYEYIKKVYSQGMSDIEDRVIAGQVGQGMNRSDKQSMHQSKEYLLSPVSFINKNVLEINSLLIDKIYPDFPTFLLN